MNKMIVVVTGCGILALFCFVLYRPSSDGPGMGSVSGIASAPPPEQLLPADSLSAPQPGSQPPIDGAALVLLPENEQKTQVDVSANPALSMFGIRSQLQKEPSGTQRVRSSSRRPRNCLLFQYAADRPFLESLSSVAIEMPL